MKHQHIARAYERAEAPLARRDRRHDQLGYADRQHLGRRRAKHRALGATQAQQGVKTPCRVQLARQSLDAQQHVLDRRPARADRLQLLELIAGRAGHLLTCDVRLAAQRLAQDARIEYQRAQPKRP